MSEKSAQDETILLDGPIGSECRVSARGFSLTLDYKGMLFTNYSDPSSIDSGLGASVLHVLCTLRYTFDGLGY